MIRFKNHNPGFSFIEIVVTVLMFGILVSALLFSVSTSYNSVTRYSNKLERIFLLKQRLFNVFLEREQGKDKPEKETKIQMPPTTIMYEQREPKGDSSLKKIKDIKLEKVTAQWQLQESDQTETLISFVLKPDEDKA